MLKKTITYKGYDGTERTEDFYFNFTQAEVTEIELSMDGGLSETIKRIVAAKDQPTLVKIFKDLVLKAYGEKSPDGKYFLKEDDDGRPLSRKFAQTEAYSKLFMELATDSKAAADFFNNVIPQSDSVKATT